LQGKRPDGLDESERLRAAKLAALQKAARAGFADIDDGRYRDLADDELEEYVAWLGKQTSGRVHGFCGFGDS
jgi:antitoxin ParD1/3/4